MVDKPVKFVARGRFFRHAAKFTKCPTATPDMIFQTILFDLVISYLYDLL